MNFLSSVILKIKYCREQPGAVSRIGSLRGGRASLPFCAGQGRSGLASVEQTWGRSYQILFPTPSPPAPLRHMHTYLIA
eukprot:4689449-Prymnesium_polylepis.1